MLPYTVIVVNFNGVEFLPRCLDSFLEQNPAPSGVIVVDNDSTDGSCGLVRHDYPHVRLIEYGKNAGYAAALNLGIRECRDPAIVLANNDLYLADDWSGQVLSELDTRPECGLVASKVLYMDEPDRINSTGMLFYRDMSAVNRGLDELDRGQYDDSEDVFGAYGAVMVFRREVFDRVGLFDEDYYLFREEDELMWRMHRAGWITRYAPGARVFHKRSARTGMFSPLKLYYSERNRFWNVLKHMPLRCTVTTIPFVLCRYWANLMLAFRGGGTSKGDTLVKAPKALLLWTLVKAWCTAFLGMPRMFAKRLAYRRFSVLAPKDCLRLARSHEAQLSDMVK